MERHLSRCCYYQSIYLLPSIYKFLFRFTCLNSSLSQNIIHKATHRYGIGSGWTGTYHKLGTLSDFVSGLTNDKVISFTTKTWSGINGGFNIALDGNDVYLAYNSVTSGGYISIEVCYLE